MYVRQISRRNKDGSRTRYLQLAHKVRDPDTGMPRDKVLHHFGREDQIDQAQLKRLIKSISRFLDPADRAQVQAGLDGLGGDLSVECSLRYGGSYVLDQVWKRLELDKALGAMLDKRDYSSDIERLLFAMVANRALDPRSKLGVERWVGRHVAIDGLEAVQVHALYRAMDFLEANDAVIQETVYWQTATLLNLDVDLLFFDTTTTYFEIEQADPDEDGLRQYGRPSKDHRPELPQVVIGLAVTRGGIPVRCWTWPGNTADASVVEEVQRDLAGWKLNRVVWVMDRGFAGEKQRQTLQRGGGHVILGEKLRSAEKVIQQAMARQGRYKKVRDNLEVKEAVITDGSLERRFVLVRNPQQAKKDRQMREALVERLQAEIERLNAQLTEGRRPKGHSKAVCALKADARKARFVRELKTGQLRLNRAALREDARFDGKFLLSTTDPSLSAEEVALGYKQLQDVERGFRTLKHTLELRPLYHRLPERIRAHVLLCWLALLLIRVIESETGQTWDALRDDLDRIHQVKLSSKDGAYLTTTELGPNQRKALSRLDIRPPKRLQEATLTA
jgi:transposase